MDQISIIYPTLVMFAHTMIIIFTMGLARFIAIHKGDVSIKFFRTYCDGAQTERLHLIARHVQNLFEVPPLFYLGCLFLFVTNSVTSVALGFAWAFVGLRLLHSIIHLSVNNVSYRFFCFGAGLMAVSGLWICLAVALLSR